MSGMRFQNVITGAIVTPAEWQLSLTIGDHYIIEQPTAAVGDEDGLTTFDAPAVYGEIIDSEGCQPGYFYVRGYSQWCPGGEIGLFNICEATRKLTAQEFEQARQRGWAGEGGEGEHTSH